MAVYWVRSGDADLVKVGYASDVTRRLALLQTGSNPHRLALLRKEPGDRGVEGALHQHYRVKRVRAEWFALTDADVQIDMTTLPRTFPPVGVRTALAEYAASKTLTMTALAELLGIDGLGRARTVQRYVTGQRIPDRLMVRKIEEATSGAVTWCDWPDVPLRGRFSDRAAA